MSNQINIQVPKDVLITGSRSHKNQGLKKNQRTKRKKKGIGLNMSKLQQIRYRKKYLDKSTYDKSTANTGIKGKNKNFPLISENG